MWNLQFFCEKLKTLKQLSLLQLLTFRLANLMQLYLKCRSLEQTLCFHELLKKEEFLKEEIDGQNIGTQSPAEVAICSLQKLLTLHMPLKGNVGWNTTKFHQLWHYIEYIIRNGSHLNWESSDGERIGKTFKDLALQTSHHGATMNHGIAQRS